MARRASIIGGASAGLIPGDSMPLASFLLVIATLATPQQDPGRPASSTTDRPHRFAVGGTIGVSTRGAGGAVRYWFGERLGVDLQAAWSRPINAYGNSTGNTFQVLPSVVFMLRPITPNADIDVRPYVGGGFNYLQTSAYHPPTIPGASTSHQDTNGIGGQAFGGIEMTFRDAQKMTISAEVVYYNLPIRTISAQAIDGFNFTIAFHYYLK